MKTWKVLSIVLVVASLTATAALAGDWLDPANCAMCKNLVAEPGLLEHMGWEHYLIEDGVMSVTTLPAEYAEAYARAQKGMQAVSERLMAGEALPLCNHCQAMGVIMATGKAKIQNVDTIGGHVMLFTSHEPEIIEKIHVHGERTIDEMKAMMAAEEQGES